MRTTFTPENISDAAAVLLRQMDQVDGAAAGIDFFGHAPDLKAANILFREVIGWIPSLDRSLLGLHPQCAEQLNIDPRFHRELRKFENPEELEDFKEYLSNLIAKSDATNPGLQPQLEDAGKDRAGFTYTVHSGRARISLYPRNDCYGGWDVRGLATFGKPERAERISATLTKNNIDVLMACISRESD